VRGGLYRAGYESPDPDTWPAESRSSFTTALLPPTIESATWERTAADSERIRLTITPAHAEADIRVYRDAALIATIPAPGNTESLTFDDTTALGLVSKTNHTYTVRSATAHVESADSAPVTRWVGPDAPENVVVDDGGGQRWYAYRLSWDAEPAYEVEIQDSYECLAAWATRATQPSSGDSGFLGLPKTSAQEDTGDNGIPAAFQARIRHFLSSFGVVDHSEWVQRSVVVRIADDETEYNACNGGGGGGGGGGGDDDPPPEET